MRRLRWLLLLLLCLGGIGLYRGWFSFTKTNNDKDNEKIDISVSVDKSKIKADAKKVKEEISGKVSQEIKEFENREKGQQPK
jgi:hypothetical protein